MDLRLFKITTKMLNWFLILPGLASGQWWRRRLAREGCNCQVSHSEGRATSERGRSGDSWQRPLSDQTEKQTKISRFHNQANIWAKSIESFRVFLFLPAPQSLVRLRHPLHSSWPNLRIQHEPLTDPWTGCRQTLLSRLKRELLLRGRKI